MRGGLDGSNGADWQGWCRPGVADRTTQALAPATGFRELKAGGEAGLELGPGHLTLRPHHPRWSLQVATTCAASKDVAMGTLPLMRRHSSIIANIGPGQHRGPLGMRSAETDPWHLGSFHLGLPPDLQRWPNHKANSAPPRAWHCGAFELCGPAHLGVWPRASLVLERPLLLGHVTSRGEPGWVQGQTKT